MFFSLQNQLKIFTFQEHANKIRGEKKGGTLSANSVVREAAKMHQKLFFVVFFILDLIHTHLYNIVTNDLNIMQHKLTNDLKIMQNKAYFKITGPMGIFGGKIETLNGHQGTFC